MSLSKSRGMTLMEVVVYCFLLGLFSTMLFVALPVRATRGEEDIHEATTVANTALQRLTLELGNSSATSVTLGASPVGVSFLTANTNGYTSFAYLSTGELAWVGWVGYALQKANLVRVYYPLTTGMARASVTTIPTLTTMISGGTTKIVCQRVSAFTVTSPSSNLWQFDLSLLVDRSKATVSTAAGARN